MGILARLGFALYLLAILAGIVAIGLGVLGASNGAYVVALVSATLGIGIMLLGRLVYWVLAGA